MHRVTTFLFPELSVTIKGISILVVKSFSNMSETILKVESLDKKYGNFHAVKGISFEVKQGQVFGILGPNGSGKTTTLAMLLGVLQPNFGKYVWFDNGDKVENRFRIGSLLETPNFYPYLTAIDNLRIVGLIKRIDKLEERIEYVLKVVALDNRPKTKFKQYSLGMKQRLAIAAALLSDPEVLVLDEPTNGLDPVGIVEVRRLIKELAAGGKTIVIASHILDEMEKLCSDLIIMHNGVIKYSGTLTELMQSKPHIVLHSSEIQKITQIIEQDIETIVNQEGNMIEFISLKSSKEINKKLAEQGIYLDQLYSKTQTLEKEFLEILKNETAL